MLAGCATTQTGGAGDGFVPLFDGRTLAGWSGEPGLWSVREGMIVGRTDRALADNTFLIREGVHRDFEVRLKYRMTTPIANTGIQYRSHPVSGRRFFMSGYQANIVTANADRTFAMLFDEHGRDMMVAYGERARIVADANAPKGFRSILEGCVNSKTAIMAAQRPYPEWNDYVVVAYGNRIVHALNGVKTLEVIDEDPRAPREGQFGLQIHRDLVMGAEFRDIAVKRLDAAPDLTARFVENPGNATPANACSG
jgi:hypothetical protein